METTLVPTMVSPARAADQKFCHSCGKVLHFSAGSCPACGATQPAHQVAPTLPQAVGGAGPQTVTGGPLPRGHVYCRGCGMPIHQTAVSCPKCGAQQIASSSGLAGTRSRTVAAVLALLLGGLGAHKFYLGQIFLGLVYLVFCWTFIPAIIAFIEGIYYLTLSDFEFAHKYP